VVLPSKELEKLIKKILFITWLRGVYSKVLLTR